MYDSVSMSDIVRQGRFRWFGHLEHMDADGWVSACRNIVVSGERDGGRGKKPWKECVADDIRQLMLRQEDEPASAIWGIIQPVQARKYGC
jgi:hypothetical protein